MYFVREEKNKQRKEAGMVNQKEGVEREEGVGRMLAMGNIKESKKEQKDPVVMKAMTKKGRKREVEE